MTAPRASRRPPSFSLLIPRSGWPWLDPSEINQRKLALESAAKAATLAPEDPVILHGLALFHSQSGNLAKAAELESRYAAKVPGDREAPVRALSFYLQAGQPKPAIELAKRALALEQRPGLHNLLGKAYEADGQSDKAILELQEAIKLAPNESLMCSIAHVLLLHQNFVVAIRLSKPPKCASTGVPSSSWRLASPITASASFRRPSMHFCERPNWHRR